MIFTALMCEVNGEPIEYYTFDHIDLAFEKLLEISKFAVPTSIENFKTYFYRDDDLYGLKQEFLNLELKHRQLYVLCDTGVRKSNNETITVELTRIYDSKIQNYKYFVMHDGYILYDSPYLDECEFYCNDRNYDVIKEFD